MGLLLRRRLDRSQPGACSDSHPRRPTVGSPFTASIQIIHRKRCRDRHLPTVYFSSDHPNEGLGPTTRLVFAKHGRDVGIYSFNIDHVQTVPLDGASVSVRSSSTDRLDVSIPYDTVYLTCDIAVGEHTRTSSHPPLYHPASHTSFYILSSVAFSHLLYQLPPLHFCLTTKRQTLFICFPDCFRAAVYFFTITASFHLLYLRCSRPSGNLLSSTCHWRYDF